MMNAMAVECAGVMDTWDVAPMLVLHRCPLHENLKAKINVIRSLVSIQLRRYEYKNKVKRSL